MSEDEAQNNTPPSPGAGRGRWLVALLAASLMTNVLVVYWMRRDASSPPPAAAAPEEGRSAEQKSGAEAEKIVLSAEAVKRAGIESAEARMQPLDRAIEAPGRLAVNADASARIGSFVEGRVTRIRATVGDVVSKDQPVVYIHSHEVAQARADYAQAQATIVRAEKSLALARIELARAERLLEAKAISARERLQAETGVNTAQAELTQARAEVRRAEEFLHHLGASPTGEDDAIIRASQSGTVLERLVTVGTTVTPATDLLRIADLSTLWAVAEVPEPQSAGIRPGQTVGIKVAAFPDSVFTGRVIHLGEALNPETRTIPVRCLVSNPRGQLRPEMYAQIRIVTGAGEQALLAPREAVAEVGGERIVFLDLGGGAFVKRRVQTGREQGDQVEILSGLQRGDRFVVRGAFYLKTALLKSSLSEE